MGNENLYKMKAIGDYISFAIIDCSTTPFV